MRVAQFGAGGADIGLVRLLSEAVVGSWATPIYTCGKCAKIKSAQYLGLIMAVACVAKQRKYGLID